MPEAQMHIPKREGVLWGGKHLTVGGEAAGGEAARTIVQSISTLLGTAGAGFSLTTGASYSTFPLSEPRMKCLPFPGSSHGSLEV